MTSLPFHPEGRTRGFRHSVALRPLTPGAAPKPLPHEVALNGLLSPASVVRPFVAPSLGSTYIY